jgi:hypothetical protein
MDANFIVLLCVIAGGLSNTLIQFFSTIMRSATPIKFDQKYWASFGLTMVSTVFAALGVFMALPIPADVPTLYVAIPALLSGYAISNVVNLGLDTYTSKKIEQAAASPESTVEAKPTPAQTSPSPTASAPLPSLLLKS